MSPPHVHRGNRRRHTSILHLSHYNHRHPYWGKSLQLTSHSAWRKHQMIPSHALSPWIHLFIYGRRPNGHRSRQLLSRYHSTRHILCSSPLPLCPIYGGCLCHYSRLCALIPTIYWLHSKRDLSKDPLPGNVCGSKYNFLSPAFPRPVRYASTLL